jgi:ribose 5-phosphate isomerase B
MKMKVYIASDHAGYEMKEAIKHHFSAGFDWEDLGTHSSESVDYPDYAHPLAEMVAQSPEARAVLLCGTGNGVAMTANKHADVRAALCWNTEIAALARQHNNANVVVLPARFIPAEEAFAIVETFFNTPFEGGRHARRVEKINTR